ILSSTQPSLASPRTTSLFKVRLLHPSAHFQVAALLARHVVAVCNQQRSKLFSYSKVRTVKAISLQLSRPNFRLLMITMSLCTTSKFGSYLYSTMLLSFSSN
ncbi:hypothetical protein BDR06DRAFT_1070116, partial [Suillus hirtellus]